MRKFKLFVLLLGIFSFLGLVSVKAASEAATVSVAYYLDGEIAVAEAPINGLNVGDAVGITLPTIAGEFMFWTVNGAVRRDLAHQDNPIPIIKASKTLHLKAYYRSLDKKAAVFLDSNLQYISSSYADKPVLPAVSLMPDKPLSTQVGWASIDNYETMMDVSATLTQNVTYFVAKYELTNALETVTVTHGSNTFTPKKNEVVELTSTLTNPVWKNQKGQILGYGQTLKFTAFEDVTITDEEGIAVTEYVVFRGPFILRTGYKSYIGSFDVGTKEVVEYGFVLFNGTKVQSNSLNVVTREFLGSFGSTYNVAGTYVTYLDGINPVTIYSAGIVIDNVGPTITTSIENNSLVTQGDTVLFTFEDNYTSSTSITYDISLLLNGEAVVVTEASYQFLEAGLYEFTVTAQDEALNTTTQSFSYYMMDEKELNYFESEINMPAADGLYQELNYNFDYVSEGKSSLKATVAKGQTGWPGLNFDSTYFQKVFNKQTIDLTQYFNLSLQIYNASSDNLVLVTQLKDVNNDQVEGAAVTISSQSWGEIRLNPNDTDIQGIDKTQIKQIRFFLTCADHPQLATEDLVFYVDTVQLSKDYVYMDFDGKDSLHKIKPIFENQGALMELVDADVLGRSGRVLKYSHKVGPSELIAFTYSLNALWTDKVLSFRDLEGYTKLEFDVYATAPGFNISFRIIYSDWSKHWSPNHWPTVSGWSTYSIDISTLDPTKLNNIRGIEFYINYAGANTTERQILYFDNFRLTK